MKEWTPWRRWIVAASAIVVSACATRATPPPKPTNDDFGVVVMAHGGGSSWNRAVRGAVAPLNQQYPTEVAFGMADPQTLQESVSRLEARGVQQIAVVRLFVSGESFEDRTAKILGLAPGAEPKPQGPGAHAQHGQGEHDMALWRIESQARFSMSDEGLMDAPEMGAVLAKRATHLSKHPEAEDVLILAHGPGDDEENLRWLAKLNARAQAIRRAKAFRRVEVATLREDWPDKRSAAEQHVREFVTRARAEQGTAIVIPFRVQGFGPYAEVLKSLDYVSDGLGLLPNREVTQWIARQAQALRAKAP